MNGEEKQEQDVLNNFTATGEIIGGQKSKSKTKNKLMVCKYCGKIIKHSINSEIPVCTKLSCQENLAADIEESENNKVKLTAARTILEQLGGNKFIAMTGAKNLVAGITSLSFKIPQSKNINYVKIKLTEMDDYKLEFGKITGFDYKIIKIEDNVYFDQLQQVFTEKTGLNCSL